MRFCRVLLVDDDPVFRALAEDLLLDCGVKEVATANDGHDALNALANGLEADLLVCDLNMPAHDGVSLIRELAHRRHTGKVLIISGEDGAVIASVVKLAQLQGLDIIGSIRKPLTMETLVSVLSGPASPAKSTRPSAPVDPELLQDAISGSALVPFYQAKVSMTDLRVSGAEALTRIMVKKGELVGPVPYIELAERTGVIDQLTLQMAHIVATHVNRFYLGVRPMPVSINVSPISLQRLDMPDQLAQAVESAGVPCSQVTLEVTETRLVEYSPDALDVMTRLRIKGFGLSVDDFGTGYSNIDRLRMYPFTELKIDQSFTRGALSDGFSRASVEMSVRLAKEMGLKIVAEGVETQEMWNFLADLGIDEAQGYLMAMPMPAEQFVSLLKTGIPQWRDVDGAVRFKEALSKS